MTAPIPPLPVAALVGIQQLTHSPRCRCEQCPPVCDCPPRPSGTRPRDGRLPRPYHRWNCALTPIWAQTIRDLDCNPVVHRFGLDLTAESFKRLGDALNRITEAERKAWLPAQPDTEPEDNK